MTAQDFRAVYDLKTTLEMYAQDGCEMGFGEQVSSAKDCEKAFKECMKKLKLNKVKK